MKRFLTECNMPSIFWNALRLRIGSQKRESFQSQSEARMDSTFQLNALHKIFSRMSSIGPKYTFISKSIVVSRASNRLQVCVKLVSLACLLACVCFDRLHKFP